MAYTGHKSIKTPEGQTLIEWITPTLHDESKYFNVPVPTPKQIALVISALRMHHVVLYASKYDFSELMKTDTPTEFWPIQSSIGRYFRDAAREVLDDVSEDD